jgi:hypothetical protein
MGLFGRKKLQPAMYDERLVASINQAKYDFEKAKLNEEALYESSLNFRQVKAQTAIARQKYFYLLKSARQRKMQGHWQQAFVHPEN